MSAIYQTSDLNKALKLIRSKVDKITTDKDMWLVGAWLSKLEPGGFDPEEEAVMSVYAHFLDFLLENGASLHYPFTRPPPPGTLEPLSTLFEINDVGGTTASNLQLKKTKEMKVQFHNEEDGPTSFPRSAMSLKQKMFSSLSSLGCRRNRKTNKVDTNLGHLEVEPERRSFDCSHIADRRLFTNSPDLFLSFKERLLQTGSLVPQKTSDCYQVTKGQNNMNKINDIISRTDDCERLYRFIYRIAPYTVDGGSVMKDIVSVEMSQFRDFVRNVLETRIFEIGNILAKEEVALAKKFETSELYYRAKIKKELTKISNIYPTFDYQQYLVDKNYSKSLTFESVADQAKMSDEKTLESSLKAQQLRADFIDRLADEAEENFIEKEKQFEEIKKKVFKISGNMKRSIENLKESKTSLLKKVDALYCRYSNEAHAVNMMLREAEYKGINLACDKHLLSLIQMLE